MDSYAHLHYDVKVQTMLADEAKAIATSFRSNVEAAEGQTKERYRLLGQLFMGISQMHSNVARSLRERTL